MMFQRYIPGEDKLNEIIFHVPIESAKKSDLTDFRTNAPAIKYIQHEKNTCCISRLAYALYYTREKFCITDYCLTT